MELQQTYLQELQTNNDVIAVTNKYFHNINNENITNEIIDNIDISCINIYAQYFINLLITNQKQFKIACKNLDENHYMKLLSIILIYSPKTIDLIMYNKTIEQYNTLRETLIKTIESLSQRNKNTSKVIKMLRYELTNDFTKITSFEYFYYITWAKFKQEFVDMEINNLLKYDCDILHINATYNLKHLDTLIMYNNVTYTITIPVLTKELIEKTKRYKYIDNIVVANTPYTITDNKLQIKNNITTEDVIIIIDYNNGYCTVCLTNYNTITTNKQFANDIINRKIKCNTDKQYWNTIIDNYMYDNLPRSCYHDKLDKSLLIKTTNVLKRIVIECFIEGNVKRTIHNIIEDSRLKQIMKPFDITIFKLYLSYLKTGAIEFTITNVINYVNNYIFDALQNETNLLML